MMPTLYDEMRRYIAAGQPEEALRAVDEAKGAEGDATALYLKGNALMSLGRRRDAMNAYLRSRSLAPDGPAAQALAMMGDIMNFYHKDLYNP